MHKILLSLVLNFFYNRRKVKCTNVREFEKEKRITRRSFLTMLTGAGIVGTAATLTGCTKVEEVA